MRKLFLDTPNDKGYRCVLGGHRHWSGTPVRDYARNHVIPLGGGENYSRV